MISVLQVPIYWLPPKTMARSLPTDAARPTEHIQHFLYLDFRFSASAGVLDIRFIPLIFLNHFLLLIKLDNILAKDK